MCMTLHSKEHMYICHLYRPFSWIFEQIDSGETSEDLTGVILLLFQDFISIDIPLYTVVLEN